MIHPENFRDKAQSVRQSARMHLMEIRRARLAKRGNRAEKQSTVIQEDYLPPAIAPVIATTVPGEQPDLPEILPPPESTAPYDNLDQVALTNLRAEGAVVPQHPAQPAAPKPDADFTPTTELADRQAAIPRSTMPVPLAIAEDAKDKAVRIAALAELAEPPDAAVTVAEPLHFTHITAEPDVNMGENLPIEAAAPLLAAPLEAVVPPVPESDVQAEPSTILPPDTTSSTPETDLNSLPGAGPGLVWMLQQCGVYSLQDLACTEASVLVPKLGLVGQILNIEPWLDFAKSQRPVL